MESGIVG